MKKTLISVTGTGPVPVVVYVGAASAASGEGVCPDLIMTGIGEQEGYGASLMGLIGDGLARGWIGTCCTSLWSCSDLAD